MKLPSWLCPSDANRPPLLRLFLLLAHLSQFTQAITFDPVPSANLNLDNLGQVGLAGDFNGISLYEFEGQNENGFNTNGSQSVLARFPDGGFATLASADAGIQAMCSFIMQDGAMAGVVVGGNFTSLGGIESPGAALFNQNTSAITPLTGLSGQVSALLCDEDTNTVYVGGSFKGANSTNAVAWVGTAGWTNLPFSGFNGPVTSITKASNGHIVFGGSFTGLGNATGPSLPDQQIINISGANITSGSSTSTAGFSDPSNIVCKTSGIDGAGNTWLLADNTPGFWKASFGFGFEPTKLRLWNTHQDGRGTQTWRYTAFPIDGIMNFTYIDPTTGQNASCTSECPLSSNSSIKYQDFHFVNVIGMNGFQIDISAWYGAGGGLDGIELFENDIFSYAIDTFNEPTCAGIQTASTATNTGPWVVTPSQQSSSEYLTATLSGSESASVVFLPDIKQSGNYSVNMYTPGCIQDNTCTTRGRVNITGVMSTGTTNSGFQTDIFQTNNYDKYDQIYFGYIEAGSASFRPSVTLSPAPGQDIPNLSIVAHRVGFTLISSSGGLNSLFEYDPTQAVVDTSTFINSTFDQAGASLPTGAGVNALQTLGDMTYVGGNFTTTTFNNIFAVSTSGTSSLSGSGLNGQVMTMLLNGTLLYVGGKFSNTSTGGSIGLSNVAVYDTSKNTWSALGAGVNGLVTNIVPLLMNITSDQPETVITLTGDFTQIIAFGNNDSVAVTGFAVWVPSHNNWLQNLPISTMAIDGELTASAGLPGGGYLFAGSLSSSQLSANGAAVLSSGISAFPVHIQTATAGSSNSLSKRATSSQNVSGVVTGLFYDNGGRNVTILGGHFTATGSNGSDVNNLVFINGSNSDTVTGVGPSLSQDSTILSLALQGDTLYAGGILTGTVNGASVNGLISFNLITSTFDTQPPALAGGDVNAISVRPSSADVYVAGSFSEAGSLSCPAVCVFSASQWDRPGSTLGGIANAMVWGSQNYLVVGGALSVNGVNTSLATYNVKAQNWTAGVGATAIPGPVTALAAATSDASQVWVAGTATNGSTFLMKFDGTNWNSVSALLASGSTIRGLQVLSLSKNHASSSLVPASETLMITGALNIPGFGNASAALFNGTTFQPFALTTTAANTGGSLSQIFSQNQNFFSTSGRHLAKGFVVLIALGIALVLTFLLVVAGLIADRLRKRREGYSYVSTDAFDRSGGMSRVPPEQLFSSLGQGRSGVEKQSTMI
ncbi:cellular morphogenesis protein [Hyaloscypha variabilis F]|uniref:Cellular morphogenesis protein n=1 Tax=Hyaloscypha variabilis (strain UAMH 11265 / GT02V1 / F) TaxID=1149755 RepID=A0A2J6RNS2_HYAVF|nr:cellular morphogenesis protein [Hyaloscypha variabilis F]